MKKNLTIVAVDTAYHSLTRKSVEKAIEITGSDNVVILSDQEILPGSKLVKIDPIDAVDYNRIILKELVPHIETDNFMIVQYDGMPYDETHWDDDYLKYDYIGAPWPWGPENRQVGNGGFSIRSRKLIETCLDPVIVFNPPGHGNENFMEDTHICHMYRSYLESKGINFAPVPLAKKFSAEIPGGKFDTFGFHGTLCLPYYLNDSDLEFFIDNMNLRQYNSDTGSRILFGLYVAERWEHLEHMMDRGCELIPGFKEKLMLQLTRETNYFPNLTTSELENLLVNY